MKKTIANALHSGPFSIKSGTGRGAKTEIPLKPTDQGVIHLPDVDGKLITQANQNSLKAHEYGHVAMTERNILSLSFMEDMRNLGAEDYLTQACMDAAVNAFIQKRCVDLPFEHDLMSKNKFLDKFRQMDIKAQTAYLTQVNGVYYGGLMCDYSKDKRKQNKKMETMRNALEAIMIQNPLGDEIINASRRLAQYCRDSIGRSSRNFNQDAFFEYSRNLIITAQQAERSISVHDELNEKLREYDFPIAQGCVWGSMDIKEMKLDNSMMRNWKQVYRPKYMGSMRYMHRAITDMKVWGLKDRSIPPMAVLLDLSGSMNLNEEDIVAILEKQPASVVAGYSGSEEKGSLYILGQNGKYASAEEIERMRDEVGYGNIVDGPALVWLSQQKGRKIWISDGSITGFQETQSPGLFEFVDEMLKRFGIEMYRSLYNLENNSPSAFWKRKFNY